MDERLERAPIGIIEATPGGEVRAVNRQAATLLDCDSPIDDEATIRSIFPDSVDRRVPETFETKPTTEHNIEEYYPEPDRWLSVDILPSDDRLFVYVRDVNERYRAERRIVELEDELSRAVSINGLVEDILDDIVTATNREEIAETICTRLGGTKSYEFAWVGEREPGTDRFVMRSATGTSTRTLEQIESALEAGDAVPELRAVEMEQPKIFQPLGEADGVPESIRRAAFADGLQSLLAVPITDGSNIYGVVGIYTADQAAFSERERSSFDAVGKLAGFAVNATRHRSILLSDTVVELSVQVTDNDAPLVAAVADRNCAISVRGVVSGDKTYRCYLEIEGVGVDEVQSVLGNTPEVRSMREMTTFDDGGTLAVILSESSPLGQWLSRGGSLRSARYEDGAGEIVIDLPKEEDIRRIADAFTRRYKAEVTGKRERELDLQDARKLQTTLVDELTDRQREALRTALYADYFESPHGSSSAEIAESLGITGPTFLHHLRAGQRKLLEAVFNSGSIDSHSRHQ